MKVACYRVLDTTSELEVLDGPAALQSWLHEVPARADDPASVAWWIPVRHEPSLDEAISRLAFLREHGPSPYAFPPRRLREPLAIDRVSLDDVDVQSLIAQLNADLLARYPEPGALVFSLEAADVVDGVGALLMATHNDRPVGCGAFKVLPEQARTAEIKRMFVVPSARGQDIGTAILAELERRAGAIGIERFVLELGPRQPEAIRRYERAGYAPCEPWGEFVGKDLSICMAKA
ncbi:MAG: hypothetical protein JWM34_1309 [Ilumatobacteraceae bacterium]|nr:hypothetical protein [Ilumatobacteraceae bacterium]